MKLFRLSKGENRAPDPRSSLRPHSIESRSRRNASELVGSGLIGVWVEQGAPFIIEPR